MDNDSFKNLAQGLELKQGAPHDLLRRLIVQGFFDEPKTTADVVLEIRQTSGKRLQAGVVPTYMRKFMEKGIIQSFQRDDVRGNLWVAAGVGRPKKSGSPVNTADRQLTRTEASNPSTTKTKILFLAANPNGTNALALDQECREIEEKLRASARRENIEFHTKWAVRPKDLLQYLNECRAEIIHFSGHGSATDELILADAADKAKPVSKAALKQLFTTFKDNIRVVVLNACYSHPQAEAITEVIDCAVGMSKSIGDRAAIVFAAAFYQAIGFGRSVRFAFDAGKTALLLEGIPEDQTPKLVVRRGVNADEIILAG